MITPNIPEAEVLWGRGIATKRDMEAAAAGELSERFGVAVLVKGGHGISDADDVLAERGFTCWLPGERIENDNTHGTGCTLSSAIACGLAKGFTVFEACNMRSAIFRERLLLSLIWAEARARSIYVGSIEVGNRENRLPTQCAVRQYVDNFFMVWKNDFPSV